eukprot:UN4834
MMKRAARERRRRARHRKNMHTRHKDTWSAIGSTRPSQQTSQDCPLTGTAPGHLLATHRSPRSPGTRQSPGNPWRSRPQSASPPRTRRRPRAAASRPPAAPARRPRRALSDSQGP